jgi:hypothetical protein
LCSSVAVTAGISRVAKMEKYLRDLAARILRISRGSLDMGTGRKLRELAKEVSDKAAETERLAERDPAETASPHRTP